MVPHDSFLWYTTVKLPDGRRSIRPLKGGMPMTIMEMLAVIGYTATIFSVGYMLGRNSGNR